MVGMTRNGSEAANGIAPSVIPDLGGGYGDLASESGRRTISIEFNHFFNRRLVAFFRRHL